MQVCKQPYYEDRCLYYVTYPIQEQAIKGSCNFKLQPVYHLAILNFMKFDKNEDYLNNFSVLNEKTYEKFSENLKFITVELPKFKKSQEELKSNRDYWLYFFKHLS